MRANAGYMNTVNMNVRDGAGDRHKYDPMLM